MTDPSSSQFHHYLARGQFASRFGPTQATIDAVRSQLQADGLQVTGVSSDGLMVDFKAPANTVERAFHTGSSGSSFRTGQRARRRRAPSGCRRTSPGPVSGGRRPQHLARPAPLGLAPPSLGGGTPRQRRAGVRTPRGLAGGVPGRPAPPQKFGGLTDDQIANAYGAFGLYGAGDLGAGQHIAIYELEPFAKSDVKTFDKCYFGAMAATQMAQRLHVIPVDGGQPAGPGVGRVDPRRRGRLGDGAGRGHRRLRGAERLR